MSFEFFQKIYSRLQYQPALRSTTIALSLVEDVPIEILHTAFELWATTEYLFGELPGITSIGSGIGCKAVPMDIAEDGRSACHGTTTASRIVYIGPKISGSELLAGNSIFYSFHIKSHACDSIFFAKEGSDDSVGKITIVGNDIPCHVEIRHNQMVVVMGSTGIVYRSSYPWLVQSSDKFAVGVYLYSRNSTIQLLDEFPLPLPDTS
eukprot:PhF_6_TR10136/c0_g1_i1/m.15746